MSDIQRRALLEMLIGGATVAAAGALMSSTAANAAPLPVGAAAASLIEAPIEDAAVRTTCWWRRGRRVCYRRPARRRVCWWRGGRRICRW
ncbi:hypothetical protein [Methylocystis echinoides]|jgi:hypothetical protein|uniref:hypothetical protein n=1 Tax=Methylocystis echinoides TaxID=29468 RepID=UPI00342F2187